MHTKSQVYMKFYPETKYLCTVAAFETWRSKVIEFNSQSNTSRDDESSSTNDIIGSIDQLPIQ